MRRLVPLVVVAAAMSTSLIAQSKPSPSPSSSPSPAAKPDFSGTWVFTTGEDGFGGPGRGGFNLGLEFTVKQDDKTMTVDTNMELGGPRQFVYKLDGSATLDDVGRSASKISWDGPKLVITTSANPPRTQTWSLDQAVGRLTVVSMLNAGTITVTTTAIYQKK